jgi:pyruvate formate lyase activating enzyme
MLTGLIFDIKRYAINDGPGIRTAIFFKGCPLDCWWCHNPEGKQHKVEMMYRKNYCTSCGDCIPACPQGLIHLENDRLVTEPGLCQACGTCTQVCVRGARELVGKEMSLAAVMAEIHRDVVFYDQSGGGVTLTGGEPLMQHRFAFELLRRCKGEGIHTVLDTSGYASWKVISKLVDVTDLFLYDLKMMDDSRHIKYTGVSNHLILENLTRLCASGARVLVRVPLIPGINDDQENLMQTRKFLDTLPSLAGVEVLPYHDSARAKYEALGLEYRLPEGVAGSITQFAMARELVGA